MKSASIILRNYGVDVVKLLTWLQQPSQGIVQAIAMEVIAEVCKELEEGKEWWKEPLMYNESFRHLMVKKEFERPSFWIDNYILERCKWVQEDNELVAGTDNSQLALLEIRKLTNRYKHDHLTIIDLIKDNHSSSIQRDLNNFVEICRMGDLLYEVKEWIILLSLLMVLVPRLEGMIQAILSLGGF
jgi:hypothetical protein